MIDFTAGAAREAIPSEDVAALRKAGALIEDVRRERPRYFDGRFLAARDLIRDQQYMLAREAFLAQALGGGVAAGLHVERGGGADEIVVERGHGLTPAGELTVIPRNLPVKLADIPLSEQLSARFGLSRRPQPAKRNRTGLYVLALRPVEFTANPIGAYPTSITGQRTVEDGDVIEATAVVLVPWTDDSASDALEARRGRAARAIFVEERPSGVSSNVLPIAMVALQNNTLAWLDVPMVRRELGADRADLPALGLGTRTLRLAHLLQYQSHLAETLAANRGVGFAATRFPALPPAGPMPAGMIDTSDFTQTFFPAEIDVELAPIPEDELPALVEEALGLPPIDFNVPPELLDSTAVLVLAPVPRTEWRATAFKLQQEGVAAATRRLLPAAANRLAARKPLEIIQRLRLPRLVATPVDTTDPREQEWARLAARPDLWFVRRRNLAYRDDLPGVAVPFAGSETVIEESLRARIADTGLAPQLDGVMSRATTSGAAEVTKLLASKRMADSPALTAAAIGELSRAKDVDRASVLAVSAKMAQPGVGEGLEKLEKTEGVDIAGADALKKIAEDAEWRTTDEAARAADDAKARELAAGLKGEAPPVAEAGRQEIGGSEKGAGGPAPQRAPQETAPKLSAKGPAAEPIIEKPAAERPLAQKTASKTTLKRATPPKTKR
jgi:hypothetical protein